MQTGKWKSPETPAGLFGLVGAGLMAAVSLAPVSAQAWSAASAVRDGCHEAITFSAIQNASPRWPNMESPPAPTADDMRVINDVPFDLPATQANIWAVTVVLANREVDLAGFEPDDLPELSHHHALPEHQAEHCLRAPAHDHGQGDEAALGECRDFIMNELGLAIGSADGVDVDLAARERNGVYLVFRESVDASLPRYHYHLGRALHALQDGFSHQFRDPMDLSQVRHVLNYSEFVGSPDYDVARDGFEHLSYLDACNGVDAAQVARMQMASLATEELIEALALDDGGNAGRLARAREVLMRYLSDPGMECTASNGFCSAPEPALSETWSSQQSTCSVSGAGSTRGEAGAGAAAAMLLAIGAWLARRRLVTALAAAVLALGLLGSAIPAAAQDTPAAAEEPPAALPAEGEPSSELSEAGQERAAEAGAAAESRIEDRVEATGADEGDPIQNGFGMYLFGRGSLQEAALAGGLGVRLDLGSHFTVGLDLEYNPWINLIAGGQGSSPGVMNIYGTGTYKWDVEDYLEVRSTVHLGISYMLDDLYEAPAGSIGPFLGVAPVGLAFRIGGHLRFVVDPGVMIPIPSMKGVPLARVQYGLTMGLQWNP
jgi:hypothetical protein